MNIVWSTPDTHRPMNTFFCHLIISGSFVKVILTSCQNGWRLFFFLNLLNLHMVSFQCWQDFWKETSFWIFWWGEEFFRLLGSHEPSLVCSSLPALGVTSAPSTCVHSPFRLCDWTLLLLTRGQWAGMLHSRAVIPCEWRGTSGRHLYGSEKHLVLKWEKYEGLLAPEPAQQFDWGKITNGPICSSSHIFL